MKKLNLILTAALAFSFIATHAQVNQSVVNDDGRQLTVRKEQSQPATGSMFINDKYLPAKLSTGQNVMLLRYNGYSDFFEINNPQSDEVKSLPRDPNTEITFTVTNDTYKILDYKTEDGEAVNGYLNVISESPKVSFYKRERVILQPEYFPTNSYQTYKPANYKKVDDEFYVKINDGEIVYLSNRRKDIAKLFPSDKEKEVVSFIKKNKISLDKEADLVQLAGYIEGIL